MLKVLSLEKNEEWDKIVKSFKDYDSYYLSGYVKAFQIHGDGEPLLFYYEDKEVRGINVVMKRDIAEDSLFEGKIEKNKYFDLITPYGYGGWLIEGENSGELIKKYEKWCRKRNVISEFVRFHPVIENHKVNVMNYDVIKLGEVITMDVTSSETVFNNLISQNRNKIRKAIKNGIKIYNGRFKDIYKQFKVIYDETMDKDEAEKYYYFSDDFYESILEDLPENAQIFYAEYEGQVIAASIILGANKKLNYHLSGSLTEHNKLAPINLILYKVALWGAENGYESFYLGGGLGSQEDNLFKFKKSFYRGEDNHRFHIGKKVFNQEKYDELCSLRGNIETNFFPEYRVSRTKN